MYYLAQQLIVEILPQGKQLSVVDVNCLLFVQRVDKSSNDVKRCLKFQYKRHIFSHKCSYL